MQRTLKERFEEKYEAVPFSGCWIWTASLLTKGYGRIGVKEGYTESAHRVSWLLHKGPIPEGMHVLHHCDVRPCVNPGHLFLGTDVDNIEDCLKKGRLRGWEAKKAKPLSAVV